MLKKGERSTTSRRVGGLESHREAGGAGGCCEIC